MPTFKSILVQTYPQLPDLTGLVLIKVVEVNSNCDLKVMNFLPKIEYLPSRVALFKRSDWSDY